MLNSFKLLIAMLCLAVVLTVSNPTNASQHELKVESSEYGVTKSGETVRMYVCTNINGVSLTLIEYGATICDLQVPDQDGKFVNVVLGCADLAQYESQTSYLGSTIGRYCNRIAGAQFEIDDKEYELAKNNGEHHLHGGKTGWDRAVWKSEPIKNEDAVGVNFTHISPDGDEGYPGKVTISVSYVLDNENRLTIECEAKTNKPTHLNLTNHTYFNLAGNGNIFDHQLRINTEEMIAVDDQLIPTGNVESVVDTPFDFTQWHRIGWRIEEVGQDPFGYDQSFVFPGTDELVKAAEVIEPNSGRKMTLATTSPSVEFYTGHYLDGSESSGGHPRHSGFCLAAMRYADAPNQPAFPTTVLKPGETFHEKSQFSFSVASSEEMKVATAVAEEISFLKMIQYNADLVVSDAGTRVDFEFGYDEASLKWIERFIDREKANWDETKRQSMLNLYGCYFGECVRRNNGGKWIQSDEAGVGVEVAKGYVVFPFNKVRKYIDNGSDDSFVALYNSISVMLKISKQRLLESGNDDE